MKTPETGQIIMIGGEQKHIAIIAFSSIEVFSTLTAL
jgi:hypothetical protein